MAEITEINPGVSTRLREVEVVPAADVYQGAIDAGVQRVVIVGLDRAGELYLAGTHSADMTLALLARATARIAAADDHGLFGEAG